MRLFRVLTYSLGPVLLASFFSAGAQPPTSPAAPVKRSCIVVNTDPNDGEIALAKKSYGVALAFYRGVKDLPPEEVSLGVTRSLIGQDKVAEALAEAQSALQKSPKSAIAEVALGEVAYRNADFVGARAHAINAYHLDPCEARAMDLSASLYDLQAMYASEIGVLDNAHRVRPKDELILRDWIGSLPRKQRAVELERYLNTKNALSEKDRNEFSIESQHLKARRPGECHISSKADTTTVPFSPIYSDGIHLEAYGLDVAFNGKKRRLQIDTGASGILLTPGAAKRLGLTAEYPLKAGGVGDEGDADSYLTHVASIQIGDVQLTDCMVEVLKKSKLDVDGLIGLDVFSHWLATLDYPHTKLLLAPLPPRSSGKPTAEATAAEQADEETDTPHDAIVPPQMQDWLHVIRIGHNILLPSKINGGPLHYVIADTGASQTVLSTGFAKEAGKLQVDSNVEFSGISGKVKKTYYVENAALIFGMFRMPPLPYFAFDMTTLSHDEGTEVSGMIGLPTLSLLTMTVDYRDNLIKFVYDPKLH